MKLPDISSITEYAVAIILLLLVAPFVREFMKRAGADSYDWVRKAVSSNNKDENERDIDQEQDWDTKRIILVWVQWVIIMLIFVIFMKLPELFMPPVVWYSMEILMFIYLACMNAYHWAVLDTFERFRPNGREVIWGKYGIRRRATKMRMMKINILFLLILILMTLGERNVTRTIANNYCLSDLPSTLDKFVHSFRAGVPIKEISEEQLRNIMRTSEANEQVEEGLCKR